MIKIINNDWNFSKSAMMDTGKTMIKKAGGNGSWYAVIKSSPGHTIVSAIFLGSGEYYGCFSGDVEVTCHENDKIVYKKIMDIKEGDIVSSHTGKKREVKKTFKRSYDGEYRKISVEGSPYVAEGTEEHPFWTIVKGESHPVWKPMKDIREYDSVAIFTGIAIVFLPVKKNLVAPSPKTVSNLEVEIDNSFVANRFIVHNCNRNGDYFKDRVLGERYNTFKEFGKHYKHHHNTDSDKIYGDILDSFFNDEMHRVEGLLRIKNEDSPDMIEKINRGIPVPLSMACRVPYDICSICGHKSKVLSEYCDDLKNHMGEILDDGRQVYAENPDPVFFDISEVLRGADPTAITMKKIASAGIGKKGKIIVRSDILKEIEGVTDPKKVPIMRFKGNRPSAIEFIDRDEAEESEKKLLDIGSIRLAI